MKIYRLKYFPHTPELCKKKEFLMKFMFNDIEIYVKRVP
jgi:hypothetical protein